MSEYKIHIRDYLQRLSILGEKAGLTFEELQAHLWDSVGGYRHPQPGSRLIQCGMGMLPKDKEAEGKALPPNPSIIYNGYLANGKPVSIDPDVAQWLKRDGINKIVVGHQPNGDTPFTIDELDIQVRYYPNRSRNKDIIGDQCRYLLFEIRDVASERSLACRGMSATGSESS